jgi:hypothetical protein
MLYSQLSSAPITRKHKTAIAEAISGNSSTSIIASCYVRCFATTRQINAAPHVAAVNVMLSTVPISNGRTADRDRAGVAFLLFAFCFLVAISGPAGSGLSTDPDSPVGFVFRSWDDNVTARQRST